MIDASAVYARLPDDLRRYIRSYIEVWKRYGLKHPKAFGSPDAYYSTIRRAPRGFRWNRHYPDTLYYRRQRDKFQWHITVFLDHVVVRMLPQWHDTHHLVARLAEQELYTAVAYPPDTRFNDAYLVGGPNDTKLEVVFDIVRPSSRSTPTRQACVDAFAEYVRGLAKAAHCRGVGIR